MTCYQRGFIKFASWQNEVKEGNLMYKPKSFDKRIMKLKVAKNFITVLSECKIWKIKVVYSSTYT